MAALRSAATSTACALTTALTASGRRVRKYRTFDTKRAATRAFNEHKVKMDKGTQIMPSEYAFAQWLDYWYDNIIVPQIEETTAYCHQAS